MKYPLLNSWPIASYGCSTGLAPIQVRIAKTLTINQNFDFFIGENFPPLDFLFTITIKISSEEISAITPPSFDGIDRRIA